MGKVVHFVGGGRLVDGGLIYELFRSRGTMASGSIRKLFREKGYGFIHPDVGGKDLHFRRNACGGEWDRLREGMRVEFEAGQTDRGPAAMAVRPLAAAAGESPVEEEFVNPYNFVRGLQAPASPEAARRTPLLGRCAPPPWDRYVGLSGRIHCSLLTATETFVSDSHHVGVKVLGVKQEHRTYSLFRDADGTPAIPASSLRGAVRTVFEAATSSCFLLMNRAARYTYYQERQRRSAMNPNWRDTVIPAGELLSEEAQPCTRADELCPACRTFGWVQGETGSSSADAPAYRSRVRFTAARFGEGDVVSPSRPVPLHVLAAPHPSYGRFYLLRRDGTALEGVDRQGTEYLPGNRIRGRKLYWPHESVVGLQKDDARPPVTHQNRSIRNWLRAQASATFEIAFQNLAPAELGALLWTLAMDGAHLHRVGYGKPLGFGSVWLSAERVEVFHPDRYAGGPAAEGFQRLPEASERACVDAFREQMAVRYGRPFEELDNVADLLMLLESVEVDVPIRYPRRSSADRGFEWYQDNEGTGPGRRRALPFATAMDPALPLYFP